MHYRLGTILILFALLWSALTIELAYAQGSGSRCQAVAEGDGHLISFESVDFQGKEFTVEGLWMQSAAESPRPAVLLLPTFFGPEPPECYRWAQLLLKDWGFHSLLIDHTSAFDDDGDRGDHSLFDRLADLEGAVKYLQDHLAVAKDKIAVVGWSQGALTALLALDRKRAFKTSQAIPLAAVAAYYPTCPTRSESFPIPVLLLHGSSDEDAPVESCERLAKTLSEPQGVRLVVLESVGHQFDQPGHLNFDGDAAKRANAELKTFLMNNLGETK